MRPRLAQAAALAAGCLLFSAAPATGAVTIGQVATSVNEACDGANNNAVQEASGGTSYALPFNGVIVSWSHSARQISGAQLKLKLFRSQGGTTYRTVGETGFALVENARLYTFPTRIPGAAGDVLGFGLAANAASSPPSCFDPNGGPGDVYRVRAGDIPPNQSGDFPQNSFQVRANISAQVERDADGDGFGDETQDGCPTNASTQGTCPSVADRTKPRGKVAGASGKDLVTHGFVSLTVTPNEAGTLTAGGTINVPGSSKVYRFRRLRKTVRANVKTRIKLRLPKKGRKAAQRASRRGNKLKARVVLALTDRAGNRTTLKRTIRVKRAKRRRS